MTNFDIGPRGLAGASEQGRASFVLSRAEWISIQTYAKEASVLPTTQTEFRNSLGTGAPTDLSDFTKLINAYRAIHGNATRWQDAIYPAAISLASDIHEYGSTMPPVYYPAIKDLADSLVSKPNDQHAKAKLAAILDQLKREADSRVQKASDVGRQITEFAKNIESDKTTMLGVDGKSGLVAYYDEKYGATSKAAVDIANKLKKNRDALKAANERYNHDVVVAATTPTYAWLGPAGLVAAAVVAGIYGSDATAALREIDALKEKIKSLEADAAANVILMHAVWSAHNSSTVIGKDLASAMPVIQKIEGVWGAISNDLAAVRTLIDTNIEKVSPIIMDCGVDAAIRDWAAVADEADKFRVNAFVTEQPPTAVDQLTLEAWRLATLITPNEILVGV
ncbi:alpha-xenorhabdolysin family binary toxin subunit A [Nocardia aurantia]|uniref:Uncharacterized protein n=1 Tax=Nocardia aurantia TaxID=2585199 RepID=A0A7K0DTQ1_9NOCA|nr:alpha-xenorhabdolysin family binary toxin subunit A [Nocardia aurantia]MQY29145.1 hypothetical protein [Nocardia aurantia]